MPDLNSPRYARSRCACALACLSAVTALGVIADSARADVTSNATWTGGGYNYNWNTTGNWASAAQPSGGGNSIVHFAGGVSLSPYNDYGNYVPFGQILFDAGASSFTLNGSSIILQNAYGTAKIENNSSVLQTVNFSDGTEAVQAYSSFELDPTAGDLTINNGVYAANGQSDTLNVYGGNHTLTLNGAFNQYSGSTGSLVVQATNTVVLNATSNYSGGTIVHYGTLYANNTAASGSATGSGIVTIDHGATLAGSGKVGGSITLNGTLTAGSTATSIGTLTTGYQNWNSTGTFAAKLMAGSATGTSVSDRLVLSGLTTMAGFTFQLSGSGLTNGQTWIIADDTTGSAGAFLAKPFTLITTGAATPTANHFALTEQADTTGGGGEDLVVTYNAAPEPTSAVLLAIAAVPLLAERRRRNWPGH